MSSAYDDLSRVLSMANINTANDLADLKPTLTRIGVNYIGSNRYGWIRDIVSLYHSQFATMLASHSRLPSPRFLVERAYGPMNTHNWQVTDPLFVERAKYSCLFPGQALFLSAQFVISEEDENDVFIPVDFLASALALGPALSSGLAHLLPTRLVIKDDYWESLEILGTWDYKTGANAPIELVTADGWDLKANDDPAKLSIERNALTIPWLNGASIADFVQLAERYPDELKIYKRALAKFFDNKDISDANIQHWFQELDDSITALDIKFNLEARKLRNRGVDVGVGLAVTLAVLLVPGLSADQQATIASLFSLKPAHEALRWILDYRRLPSQLNDQKNWMLWHLSKVRKK